MKDATMTGKEAVAAAYATILAMENLKWTVEVCVAATRFCSCAAELVEAAECIETEGQPKSKRNMKLSADIVLGDATMALTRAFTFCDDAAEYLLECAAPLSARILDWEGRERNTMECYCLDIQEHATTAGNRAKAFLIKPPVKEWTAPTPSEMEAYTDLLLALNSSDIFMSSTFAQIEELQESVM